MKTHIAGYKGFQTYGQLPYPSLKSGKEVLAPNNLWENTKRPDDKKDFLENYHYQQSNYNKTQVVNVKPEDYSTHTHVQKGSRQGNSLSKTATQTLSKFNPQDEKSHLNTQVEHWQSNYNAGIKDPYQYSKAKRPDWTQHKPPYIVDAPMGKSEYKTQVGMNYGERPIDKWNPDGTLKQGKLDDPLKMGTTQATYGIPGYTGFIPEANTKGKALEHAKQEKTRDVFNKISLIDYYQKAIPGYAGFQPSDPINQNAKLREKCFALE